jgi:hypothetical protein
MTGLQRAEPWSGSAPSLRGALRAAVPDFDPRRSSPLPSRSRDSQEELAAGLDVAARSKGPPVPGGDVASGGCEGSSRLETEYVCHAMRPESAAQKANGSADRAMLVQRRSDVRRRLFTTVLAQSTSKSARSRCRRCPDSPDNDELKLSSRLTEK